MTHDEKEITESVQMLKDNPEDGIIMSLEEGDYVVVTKDFFDKIVTELNEFRMQTGDLLNGVDILVPVGEE